MTTLCKAAWSGGKCDNEPNAARGLCQGHYAQWRRATDSGKRDVRVAYTELRVVGEVGGGTVPVTVHLARDTAEAYKRAANVADKSLSELMGDWCAAGFKRYETREERRKPTG